MKKVLLTFLLGFMLLPLNVSAGTKEYDGKTYTTMNLDEALTQEKIEHDFSNYKETDDQITIYLFRGNGCRFCKKFLTFLNNNINELGKYIKVVSFETWGDKANSKLQKEVSEFLDADATGVPFIIIGDTYFPGYDASWDEDIKTVIKAEYDKKERYDVFVEMTKAKEAEAKANKANGVDTKTIVLCNFAFMVVGTAIAVVCMNYKVQLLSNKIDELKEEVKKAKKVEKVEPKKEKVETKKVTKKTSKKTK